MARLTLIRPPTVASKRSYSVAIVPPIGPAYIAAALRADGHDVQVIDACGEGLDHVAPAAHASLIYHGLGNEAIIGRIDPGTQAVAVSCMCSLEWPHIRSLVEAVARRFPRLPVLLGGEHATAMAEFILDSCPEVTCVALGEGEETALEFAQYLDGRRGLDSIASLARREDGRATRNPPRPRIRDIDSIPRPAWDLFPIKRYHEARYGFGVDLGPSLPILATRGCPYQCTFCSSPSMWSTRYRARSPEAVLDEIEHGMRAHGAENFDFCDLTAIVRRDWILAFCAGIRRRGLLFTWQLPAGTRSEALDREVLRELDAAGCRYLVYAPESGDPGTLAAIKKKVDLKRLESSIREAKRLGMTVKLNVMLGFPSDTRASLWRTMAFMLRMAWLGVEDAPVSVFSPYPGSELFEELRREGRIPRIDDDYFASLGCYTDVSVPSAYCRNVSAKEIQLYFVLSMAGFYALSYLSRPRRLGRTAANLLSGRGRTRLEQRLLELLRRRSLASC